MADVNAGTVYAKLELRDGQFRASLVKDKQELDRFAAGAGQSLGNVSAMAGRASTALLAIGTAGAAGLGALAKAAADAVESENLFTVSLGKNADAVRAWSKGLRQSLGLNEYELRKQVGMWNTMLGSIGLGERAALDMSKSLVVLANDMASFYNLHPEIAFEKLRSGIMGEIEPLRQLGIVVDENTMKTYLAKQGIDRKVEALSQAEKAEIRYKMILEQTTKAQGDLGRTLDSPVNQLRLLQSEASQAAIEFGQELLPAFKEVIGVAKDVTSALDGLTDEQKGQLAKLALYGVGGSLLLGGLGRIGSAIGGIADGVKAVNTALASGGAARLLMGGGLVAIPMTIVGGAAVWGAEKDIDRILAEREEAGKLGDWIVDPGTGRLIRKPPGWDKPIPGVRPGVKVPPLPPIPFDLDPGTLFLPGTPGGPKFQRRLPGGLTEADLFGPSIRQRGRGRVRPAPRAPLSAATLAEIASIRAGATETLRDDIAAAKAEERRLWGAVRGMKRPRRGQDTKAYEAALLAAERATADRKELEQRLAAETRRDAAAARRSAERAPSGALVGPYRRPLMDDVVADWKATQRAAEADHAAAVKQRLAGEAYQRELTAEVLAIQARQALEMAAGVPLDANVPGGRGLNIPPQDAANMARLALSVGKLFDVSQDVNAGSKGKAWIDAALSDADLNAQKWKEPKTPSALSAMLPGLAATGIQLASGQASLGDVVSTSIAPMILSTLGPWGMAAGALVGAFMATDREDERRHRELMRQQDEMVKELQRQTNALTPVSDYFRSAGFDLLPGSATFGGSLEDEIARGPRL